MDASIVDTLVVDTARIHAFRTDSDFDYSRELVPTDTGIADWILKEIGDIIDTLFNNEFTHQYGVLFWTLLGLVLLALVALFIYVKRPGLFGRNKRNEQAYDVTEDTIYGIDFPQSIAAALERGDYNEAARLIYLHTLKGLSDTGRIVWQPFKTPTQYTYEVKRDDFSRLTALFIRVRYGNFAADEAVCEEMQTLRAAIMKGETA